MSARGSAGGGDGGGEPGEPDYVRRRFRVPFEQVGFVRMIVEGYDGLAVVVTPDPSVGVIEWWIPPGREVEADALARALAPGTGLCPLPGPDVTPPG
jgi:hypothetical protein